MNEEKPNPFTRFPTYEYKMQSITLSFGDSAQSDFETTLNALGAKGWEIVTELSNGVSPRHYNFLFMRLKSYRRSE